MGRYQNEVSLRFSLPTPIWGILRTELGFKQQLLKTFRQELGDLHVSDIARVRYVRTISVKGAGQLRIYTCPYLLAYPKYIGSRLT